MKSVRSEKRVDSACLLKGRLVGLLIYIGDNYITEDTKDPRESADAGLGIKECCCIKDRIFEITEMPEVVRQESLTILFHLQMSLKVALCQIFNHNK